MSRDAWFEELYQRHEAEIPWNVGQPHYALVRWVEEARPAAGRVIIVGSGLGYDAIYLAQRGFDVTGIDIAPTAVARAHQKATEAQVVCRFLVADLFTPPPDLIGAFHYAIEVNTFQSLEPSRREAFAAALARLLGENGLALVVCLNDLHGTRDRIPYTISPAVIAACFGPHFTWERIDTTRLFRSTLHDGYAVRMTKRPASS